MFWPLLVSASIGVPSLVPKPAQIAVTDGSFAWPEAVVIQSDASTTAAATWLKGYLKSAGQKTRTGREATVQLSVDSSVGGREAYRLSVTPKGIRIVGGGEAGAFYGVQTLRQLLPLAWERGKPLEFEPFHIRSVEIQDQPRFGWRGMHLDVSRHFYPVSFIKKYIDQLAALKMNVFHWHLIDDGGWRIEIKKYPKLTQIGAWRKGVGGQWNQQTLDFADPKSYRPTYGGFYTQEQIRDIVKYAANRQITVVPEIELPGHALPAPFNYPEVGCDEGAQAAWKKATGMSYGNVYCAGKEKSFEFLEDVLKETLALFPSKYIHIGGDEVDKLLWKNCADCQARMKAEGLKDEHELQSYFVKRVEKFLNGQGRAIIGWDEILEGGLAPNATVMSWRGISGGIQAAKQGHDVVMSPTSHSYFDYDYNNISVEKVFNYDPIPEELAGDERKHVLGAQGNVWTEWMPTSRRVEQMAFPRAVALAEAVWSPIEGRKWSEFQSRLQDAMKRLDARDVFYNLPAPQAAFDAIVFDGSATVEFERPFVEGGVIRYSLDGKLPTSKSPIYRGPFTVDRSAEIKAALFRGENLSDPIRVSLVKRMDWGTPGTTPGLLVDIRVGAFRNVAQQREAPVQRTVEVSDLGLGIAGADEGFGLTFKGWIRIPTSGVYTFSTTSDDGSMLRIGGAVVVDNDGLHGSAEKRGRVNLPAGDYPFELDFFEASGAQVLKVDVVPPGGVKMPLPMDWLRR